jgi:hypothetical protein
MRRGGNVFQIELSASRKYLILFKTGLTLFYRLHMHNAIPGPHIAVESLVFQAILGTDSQIVLVEAQSGMRPRIKAWFTQIESLS